MSASFLSRAYLFGHPVTYSPCDGFWRYEDTGHAAVCKEFAQLHGLEPTPVRPCPMCHLLPTEEGHDPCVAELPGALAACCGHGVEPGYVLFEDGRVIRGYFDTPTKDFKP